MTMRRHLLAALVVLVIVSAVWTPPASAAGGRYSGKTAQGFNIRARTTGAENRIFLIRVKVKLRCHDGSLLYDDLSDFEASSVRPNGLFADVQFGPTDEVHWRGRIKSDRIRGSLRVKDKVAGGVQCDSGTVGFAARLMGR